MYRVIIVEDDPMVASINKQFLELNSKLNLVGMFKNGKEALKYIRKHKVDLAIVDYYMPILDGKEFIKQCLIEHLDIDIIMITAANNVKEISEIIKLGVLDYLVKPFTKERFLQAIEKFLSFKKTLSSNDTLNQEELDQFLLLQTNLEHPQDLLDKGLQPKTLNLIQEYLREHSDCFFTSSEISKAISLSRITVRRYMNYLLENGDIISQIDYSTGGRPSIQYQYNQK